jgi:hypothetical protein
LPEGRLFDGERHDGGLDLFGNAVFEDWTRTASFLPFVMSRSSTVRSLGATYRIASILRIRPGNLICRTVGSL